jgi:hypothetical protein
MLLPAQVHLARIAVRTDTDDDRLVPPSPPMPVAPSTVTTPTSANRLVVDVAGPGPSRTARRRGVLSRRG